MERQNKRIDQLTVFELVVIPILFLEYFVQKFLCGIYFTYMKFSYWNFNRNLDARNKKLAEQTPFVTKDKDS